MLLVIDQRVLALHASRRLTHTDASKPTIEFLAARPTTDGLNLCLVITGRRSRHPNDFIGVFSECVDRCKSVHFAVDSRTLRLDKYSKRFPCDHLLVVEDTLLYFYFIGFPVIGDAVLQETEKPCKGLFKAPVEMRKCNQGSWIQPDINNLLYRTWRLEESQSKCNLQGHCHIDGLHSCYCRSSDSTHYFTKESTQVEYKELLPSMPYKNSFFHYVYEIAKTTVHTTAKLFSRKAALLNSNKTELPDNFVSPFEAFIRSSNNNNNNDEDEKRCEKPQMPSDPKRICKQPSKVSKLSSSFRVCNSNFSSVGRSSYNSGFLDSCLPGHGCSAGRDDDDSSGSYKVLNGCPQFSWEDVRGDRAAQTSQTSPSSTSSPSSLWLYLEHHSAILKLVAFVARAARRLSFGELLLLAAVDVALGAVLGGSVRAWWPAALEAAVPRARAVVAWLRGGAPLGVKLNPQLNSALAKFFTCHVNMWNVYVDALLPPLRALLVRATAVPAVSSVVAASPAADGDWWWATIVAGQNYVQGSIALPLSLQCALVCDIVTLSTVHVYCFYGYMCKMYALWLHLLRALLRMFGGRKWNPLRRRVDSLGEADRFLAVQLFGPIVLSVVVFLSPTVIVYYAAFTLMRCCVLLVNFTLGTLVLDLLALTYELLWSALREPRQLDVRRTRIHYRVVGTSPLPSTASISGNSLKNIALNCNGGIDANRSPCEPTAPPAVAFVAQPSYTRPTCLRALRGLGRLLCRGTELCTFCRNLVIGEVVYPL